MSANIQFAPGLRTRISTGMACFMGLSLLCFGVWGVSRGYSACQALFPLIPLLVALVSGPRAFYFTVALSGIAPLAGVLVAPGGATEGNLITAVATGVLLCAILMSIVESMKLLKHEAFTDPLTGVLNRRGMAERLARMLPRLRLMDSPIAVLSLDLDHFKALNDELGHMAGDQALRIVGGVLRDPALLEAVTVRVGGDEFMAFVPELSESHAQDLANRMKSEADRRLRRAGFPTTVSVGHAWFESVPTSERTLIERADEALYAQKESRKAALQRAS